MKSILVLLTAATLFLQSFVVSAENYVAGKDYEVLPNPVATRNKNKVEVVEVFWYGCSHCFDFEPMIATWKAKLPEYADFHQMPAMWNPVMKLHAQGFYTAKALGLLDKIHQPFFSALNVEKKRMNDEAALAVFFNRFGVSKEIFDKTFNSFGVNSQVSLADSRARSYRIQGTPELVVNGKYRVASSLAGNQANMLKVASFLIEKEKATLPK
jgi:thiol:disulfide interchange protein DsbA